MSEACYLDKWKEEIQATDAAKNFVRLDLASFKILHRLGLRLAPGSHTITEVLVWFKETILLNIPTAPTG